MKPEIGVAARHSSSPTPPSMTGGFVAFTAAIADVATPALCAHGAAENVRSTPHTSEVPYAALEPGMAAQAYTSSRAVRFGGAVVPPVQRGERDSPQRLIDSHTAQLRRRHAH